MDKLYHVKKSFVLLTYQWFSYIVFTIPFKRSFVRDALCHSFKFLTEANGLGPHLKRPSGMSCRFHCQHFIANNILRRHTKTQLLNVFSVALKTTRRERWEEWFMAEPKLDWVCETWASKGISGLFLSWFADLQSSHRQPSPILLTSVAKRSFTISSFSIKHP